MTHSDALCGLVRSLLSRNNAFMTSFTVVFIRMFCTSFSTLPTNIERLLLYNKIWKLFLNNKICRVWTARCGGWIFQLFSSIVIILKSKLCAYFTLNYSKESIKLVVQLCQVQFVYQMIKWCKLYVYYLRYKNQNISQVLQNKNTFQTNKTFKQEKGCVFFNRIVLTNWSDDRHMHILEYPRTNLFPRLLLFWRSSRRTISYSVPTINGHICVILFRFLSTYWGFCSYCYKLFALQYQTTAA